MKRKLPKSIRKYIRKEKARIRREVFDLKEQERLIQEIYQKITQNTQQQLTKSQPTKKKEKDKK